MKVKAILRFYFTAERVEAMLDRLIYKKALSVSAGRGAYECAEEVAELVEKKGELCEFAVFLGRALSKFSARELEVLKRYAFSPRRSEVEIVQEGGDGAAEAHRLAVAFARRIRGGAEKYSDGMRVAAEFCFW